MPHPSPLPDELGTAFGYPHARALGVTPRRLRARDLISPHRGVRLLPHADPEPDDDTPGAADRRLRRELLHRIRGYESVRHPRAFYAGRTALALRLLPYAGDGTVLCVGTFTPDRPPRMIGVDGVKLSAQLATITEFEGLPVTSPASTWAMLASALSERQLTILADAIVRIPRGEGGVREPERQLASLEQLQSAAMAPHRRQRPKLLRALSRARVGSMSVLESEYRLAAEDAGLPEPELDVEIRDEHGRLLGIADILYRKGVRVIVEVEGDQHRTSRRQWNRDLDKYAAYAANDWEVVRVTVDHIRRSGRAIPLVRAAFARHLR